MGRADRRRDRGRGRLAVAPDRDRPLRPARRRSTPSTTSAPTTSAPRTRAATRTRSCTPRWSGPAAPASGAGSSTTASGPCAAPARRRAGDPHDALRGRDRRPWRLRARRVRRKPSDREIKMAASLVDGLHTDFDPSEYEDTYRAGRARAGRAQGGGQEHRAAEPTRSRRPPTTCSPRSRRAWRTPDAALALDRLAELRARQRPRRAVQRRARTPTCTSASCTPRTTRRSRSTASARRRTSRCRTRRSPTATRPTTTTW